jgi:hypothetical protein
MTLRMNALPFQFGTFGWTIFAEFVHRTIRKWLPFSASVNSVSHWRKLYLPLSVPSFVGCQDLPPSDLGGVADGEPNIDLGMGPAERDEMAW